MTPNENEFDCPGHKTGADQGYNTTTHHICGPVKEKIAATLRQSEESRRKLEAENKGLREALADEQEKAREILSTLHKVMAERDRLASSKLSFICRIVGHCWFHKWDDLDWSCFICGLFKEGNYN